MGAGSRRVVEHAIHAVGHAVHAVEYAIQTVRLAMQAIRHAIHAVGYAVVSHEPHVGPHAERPMWWKVRPYGRVVIS